VRFVIQSSRQEKQIQNHRIETALEAWLRKLHPLFFQAIQFAKENTAGASKAVEGTSDDLR
jgi:hypothetical protein